MSEWKGHEAVRWTCLRWGLRFGLELRQRSERVGWILRPGFEQGRVRVRVCACVRACAHMCTLRGRVQPAGGAEGAVPPSSTPSLPPPIFAGITTTVSHLDVWLPSELLLSLTETFLKFLLVYKVTLL